ncbi:MAG: SufD family Fe-S cluster assembly protein [Coriobacteriia bacterium]|nr:SufD family Fe-S cluster assembly protein [Coriobacteriia bacterium]
MPVDETTCTAATAARLADIRAAAEAAVDKQATYGTDIDLASFGEAAESDRVEAIESIDRQMREVALRTGFVAEEKAERSASFFQVDRTPIYEKVMEMYDGKVEVMGTEDALARYGDEMVEKYWWRAVAPDKDKYTALVALHQTEGYFIRVKAGQKVDKPIQACLFISENNISQNVHNVIIIEDGAEANVITGCTIHPNVHEGLHAGISEFYVGCDAKLTFTMVHNWAEEFHVRPRTGIVCEDNGVYINNYVLLKPVRSLQSFPVAELRGDGSKAVFNSIVNGLKDSNIDIGSETRLIGTGTRSEAIARTIGNDSSVIYSRGRLVGRNNDCKAHLDCRGILFSENATMWAIPDLASEGAPGAELSHEAAISPIAAEEIYYLQTRGLTRDEAVSAITRGFLDLEIPGLPPGLRRSIDNALEQTAKEVM